MFSSLVWSLWLRQSCVQSPMLLLLMKQHNSLLKHSETESLNMTIIQYLSFLWTLDLMSVRNHHPSRPFLGQTFGKSFPFNMLWPLRVKTVLWPTHVFVSRQPPSWWPESSFWSFCFCNIMSISLLYKSSGSIAIASRSNPHNLQLTISRSSG